MSFFAHVAAACPAQFRFHPGRLVHVATKEILRLILLDEISDRRAPGVNAVAYTIERGVLGRTMADQNQGTQAGEWREALGYLCFAVLARRVKWRGTRIPQASEVVAARAQRLSVKVVKSKICAKPKDVSFGLVISGKHVHLVRSPRENVTRTLQSAAPIHQISRREVEIRFNPHQLFERRIVAV